MNCRFGILTRFDTGDISHYTSQGNRYHAIPHVWNTHDMSEYIAKRELACLKQQHHSMETFVC